MLLTISGLLGLLFVALFTFKGWQSQAASEPGLVEGHLRGCPDKPNCVSSEADVQDRQHAIAPLHAPDWQALRHAVRQAGGTILRDDGQYLHATFTSALLRYVDDVEVRRDAGSGTFHIRSASRVGHSDFGVNRKRVEAIRRALKP